MYSEDERQENPAPGWNKRPPDEDHLAPTESKRRKPDCEPGDGDSSRTGFTANDYTVGWICALHIEMAAAKCMLHDIHENLGKSPDDSNTYIWQSWPPQYCRCVSTSGWIRHKQCSYRGEQYAPDFPLLTNIPHGWDWRWCPPGKLTYDSATSWSAQG